MDLVNQTALPPVHALRDGTSDGVTLSVVIPALNEERSIGAIVQQIEATLPALRCVGVCDLEIIVVDDGSLDRTAEIAATFERVRLLRHPINRGYGAAIITGFSAARGELVAFTDADGTYPAERFPDLCRVVLEQDADIVVGSRRSGEHSEMPRVRQIGNLVWANLLSFLGNRRVADPASGMRVLRRTALERLYPLPDGLNFTPVMSTRALHESLRVVEVPIAYHERVGRSKLSIVRDGTRFLTTIVSTSLEYNPVRVLGVAGLIALGLSGAIALAFIALRVQGVVSLGPLGILGVFTALVLAVAGVSLFTLGATFNYLVSLFHGRPIRQGLFGTPVFDPPLEHYFGWLGLVCAVVGSVSGVLFGISGWDINRLWFWLVTSALLVLIGIQLVISWVLVRVLQRLRSRLL